MRAEERIAETVGAPAVEKSGLVRGDPPRWLAHGPAVAGPPLAGTKANERVSDDLQFPRPQSQAEIDLGVFSGREVVITVQRTKIRSPDECAGCTNGIELLEEMALAKILGLIVGDARIGMAHGIGRIPVRAQSELQDCASCSRTRPPTIPTSATQSHARTLSRESGRGEHEVFVEQADDFSAGGRRPRLVRRAK